MSVIKTVIFHSSRSHDRIPSDTPFLGNLNIIWAKVKNDLKKRPTCHRKNQQSDFWKQETISAVFQTGLFLHVRQSRFGDVIHDFR
jgi:hypothetical protein